MNKILHCLIVLFFCTITIIPSYASAPLCTTDGRICTMGRYTLRSPNMHLENGIMCTSNRTLCTNGHAILRTTNPSYTEKAETNTFEKKEKDKQTPQVSEADTLVVIAELYTKNLITQTEFNKIKRNKSIIPVKEVNEIKKLGSVYSQGLLTQAEYNQRKFKILRQYN